MQCHSIVLAGELSAGDDFVKVIGGGLEFRLDPMRLGPTGELDGWGMTLVPGHGRNYQDYIYPVNPPLRFNGRQILGPSYNDDRNDWAKQALEMSFLVYPADYRRISPLVSNALWPYRAPHPDKVFDEYLGALKKLRLGQVKLSVQDMDADPDTGSIHNIKFRVELTAPKRFAFDPVFKSRRAGCPAQFG